MDPITSLLVALANVLLVPTGQTPTRNVVEARDVLRRVFTGESSTQKIAAIKFVRTYTDMGLKDAKHFVESEIFNGHARCLPTSTLRTLQIQAGMRASERV